MDLYQILEIDINTNRDDIRKAYRKMVLKYHPDKTNDSNTTPKFREVQFAYEVLSDPYSKSKYDLMTNEQKYEFYDSLMTCISSLDDDVSVTLKSIIKLFYSNENELRDDINSFNINKIYEHIKSKLSVHFNYWSQLFGLDEEEKNSQLTITDSNNIQQGPIESAYQTLDIHGTIKTNLIDRYLDRYKKITVQQKRIIDGKIVHHKTSFHIPLRESEIIYSKQGDECLTTKQIGDLIINVICNDHEKFKVQDEYDLYTEENISLYQYLYGGTIDITHIDSEQLKLDFSSCVDIVPIFCVKNKGLYSNVCDDDSQGSESKSSYVKYNSELKMERGYLFVKLSILDLPLLEGQIKTAK